MKRIITLIFFLFGLTSIGQELSLSEIREEVEKINSDPNLVRHIFELNKIYEQTTDGGGTFEVWLNNREIVKITQSVFLSNGLFITTVYLQNDQPILITETEKRFQWKKDLSEIDYDKELETNFSELIYAYNWDKDPIKVETKGESLRKEIVCGLSDYSGLLDKAKRSLP